MRRVGSLGDSYPLGLVAFALGCVAAGSVVGAMLGVVGSALAEATHGGDARRVWGWLAWSAVALAYGGLGVAGRHLWVPQRRWQVPQTWGFYGRVRYAGLFGLVMGTGVLTYAPSIAFLLTASLCSLLADPLMGASVLGAFGAGRAVPVVATPLLNRMLWRLEGASVGVAANQFYERLGPVVALGTNAVLAILGGAAAVGAVLTYLGSAG